MIKDTNEETNLENQKLETVERKKWEKLLRGSKSPRLKS